MPIDVFDSFISIFPNNALPKAGIDKISAEKYFDVQTRKPTKKGYDLIMYVEKLFMNSDLFDNFKFSPFAEMLILKGANKVPRRVSKPTIKDKLVLKVLLEIITEVPEYRQLQSHASTVIPKIRTSLSASQSSLSYLSMDISSFFDNINHKILLDQLQIDGKLDSHIIRLIRKAIEGITVPFGFSKRDYSDVTNVIGVPQGLSISNILAEIYLRAFDSSIISYIDTMPSKAFYFRFVDDILLLSQSYLDLCSMKEHITNQLGLYKLSINQEKTRLDVLTDNTSFKYLGYQFSRNKISIAGKNIIKIETRLIEIIKEIRRLCDRNILEHDQIYFRLMWRLNIIISGAWMDGKHFGWIDYFQNITCTRQLSHLDDVLKSKLIPTYLGKTYAAEYYLFENSNLQNINSFLADIPLAYRHWMNHLKSFVKVFDEKRHKQPQQYQQIININNYSDAMKRNILTCISDNSIKWNEYSINYIFTEQIYSEVQKLTNGFRFS